MEILPKEQNLTVDPDLDTFISKMNIMKSVIYGKVDDSLQQVQKIQKKNYDQKHKHSKVSILF